MFLTLSEIAEFVENCKIGRANAKKLKDVI
jgi:hypothetical protein